MTQNGKMRIVSATNNEEARQSALAAYIKTPKELLGSKMEQESYLDLLTSEMMPLTRIPQSRP